jgi:hypothetical protein
MTIAPNQFAVDLATRSVTHTPSGIVFSFYEYTTEEDWFKAGASVMRDAPTWDGDRGALHVAAKAAATSAGMKYRRPS